jgi:hypothetical protein
MEIIRREEAIERRNEEIRKEKERQDQIKRDEQKR